MATSALKATVTLVDGRQALEIESNFEFDVDEASTGLAIVYANEPLRRSPEKLRSGLRTVADEGYLNQPGVVADVHPRAVAAYRERLTSQPQVMFPEPALRAHMLELLRGAQAEWRTQDPETRSTNQFAGVKLPQLWAKHDRKDADGVPLDPVVPVVRVEVARYYHLERAALALAIVHRPDLVPKSKQDAVPRADYILREQLRWAGDSGALKRSRLVAKADPNLVAEYRAMLLDTEVFDPPTT